MAQCITPVEIKNPHYGIRGTYYMAVPCGKCPNCLSDRRSDWSLRLQIELSHSTSAHFITLTYSDENLYYNDLKTNYQLQTVISELRKRICG